MFDGSLPEVGDLAALDDAALVDAVADWARTENAACARKLAIMAELFARRTGLPAGERELWWVDPQAAVGAELGAAQGISPWMALAQAHRGVVLADRMPKVAALFEAGLISELLVRAIEYRTAMVTDPESIAAVDALVADHVTAWGPLSARKTEQAIDAIVDQVDPGALRRSRKKDHVPPLTSSAGSWGSGRTVPDAASVRPRSFATGTAPVGLPAARAGLARGGRGLGVRVAEFGDSAVDSGAHHVDVGHGVVVTGHTDVKIAVVGEDRRGDPNLRPQHDVGPGFEHATSQQVKGVLGTRNIGGHGIDGALGKPCRQPRAERQQHGRREYLQPDKNLARHGVASLLCLVHLLADSL
jgi:Domain of unknown function (DUF222)